MILLNYFCIQIKHSSSMNKIELSATHELHYANTEDEYESCTINGRIISDIDDHNGDEGFVFGTFVIMSIQERVSQRSAQSFIEYFDDKTGKISKRYIEFAGSTMEGCAYISVDKDVYTFSAGLGSGHAESNWRAPRSTHNDKVMRSMVEKYLPILE